MTTHEYPKVSPVGVRVKDLGPIFVGRGELLDALIGAVTSQELNEEDEWSSVEAATVITGAPGVGKSTLIQQVAKELRAKRVGVVRLRARHLESQERLLRRLRRAKLVQQAQKSHAWLQKKRSSGKLDKLPKFMRNVLRQLDEPAIGRLTEYVRTVDEMLKDRQAEPLEILSTFNDAFPQGWTVWMDEAQQLAGLSDKEMAKEFLQSMISPSSRVAEGLERGNLVMAGLSDTQNVLDELEVTRPKYVPLGPLSPEEVRELITLHIEKGEEVNDGILVPCRLEWIDTLTNRFHRWTLHAQIAGSLAELAAQYYPNDEAVLGDIIEKSESLIGEYCSGRLSSALRHFSHEELSTIMHAERQHQGQFGRHDLETIIQRTRSISGDEEKVQKKTMRLVRGILHSGLLADLDDKTLTVPIPSLRTFCERTLPNPK